MCDEKFKSATWFQTSSTSVSGFCHAQLPLIQHTASLTPEKHFDRSAERHVLIGSSGGGRLKEQSAPSSPPCRLMEPQPQTSVQTVFPHGYIKQDVSRRVPADKTRYFKLKHLFLTQSRSFCAETRSDKNQLLLVATNHILNLCFAETCTWTLVVCISAACSGLEVIWEVCVRVAGDSAVCLFRLFVKWLLSCCKAEV